MCTGWQGFEVYRESGERPHAVKYVPQQSLSTFIIFQYVPEPVPFQRPCSAFCTIGSTSVLGFLWCSNRSTLRSTRDVSINSAPVRLNHVGINQSMSGSAFFNAE